MKTLSTHMEPSPAYMANFKKEGKGECGQCAGIGVKQEYVCMCAHVHSQNIDGQLLKLDDGYMP